MAGTAKGKGPQDYMAEDVVAARVVLVVNARQLVASVLTSVQTVSLVKNKAAVDKST